MGRSRERRDRWCALIRVYTRLPRTPPYREQFLVVEGEANGEAVVEEYQSQCLQAEP